MRNHFEDKDRISEILMQYLPGDFSASSAVQVTLIHVFYMFAYVIEGMDILTWYNAFALVFYIISTLLIMLKKVDVLNFVSAVEVFTFVTLNVVLLGWDYGFQFYGFVMMISMFLINTVNANSLNKSKFNWICTGFVGCYFLCAYILYVCRQPIYSFENIYLKHGSIIINLVMSIWFVGKYMETFINMVFELAKSLQIQSERDSLTGLFNRRRILELASEKNNEEGIQVAMLDIDFFKKVNDTYGHDVGDRVLVDFSDKLKVFCQENNCISARWGGEEFLLISSLKEKSLTGALEDFVKAVDASSVIIDNEKIHYTVTCGLVGGKEVTSALISKADELLYAGKQGGRNRLVQE